MARLRRVESQQKTRESLVGTARRLFLRDGYDATSLDAVADAAGFSKGAVYSNFRNKDELCLAVIDELHAARASEIAEAFAGTRSMAQRIKALEGWAERMIGDEGWTRLEMEFAIHARTDAQLLAELKQRERMVVEMLSSLVAMQLRELDVAPKLSPEAIALALLSLGIGLGFQRMVDRDIPVTVLTDTLRILLGVDLQSRRVRNARADRR